VNNGKFYLAGCLAVAGEMATCFCTVPFVFISWLV